MVSHEAIAAVLMYFSRFIFLRGTERERENHRRSPNVLNKAAGAQKSLSLKPEIGWNIIKTGTGWPWTRWQTDSSGDHWSIGERFA